jgi:hypothetical protein
VFSPDNNLLSFFVLVSVNINCFSVLNVDEMLSFIGEDLPPFTAGAPDLHVTGFSCALDIPRLVVRSGSNAQCLLVEVPSLSSSSVLSLEN